MDIKNDLDSLFQLKCAPTGRAVFGRGGLTFYSTFSLLINQPTMNRLGSDAVHTLAYKFRDVKILIIDEISMTRRRIFIRPYILWTIAYCIRGI